MSSLPDQNDLPFPKKQSSFSFHIIDFIAGCLLGAVISGVCVYVWQQQVWRPTVENLKKEYAQLNDSYLSYSPPVYPVKPKESTKSADFGHGEQVRTETKKYSQDLYGFSSSLFSGLSADVTVYQYNKTLITEIRTDISPLGNYGVDIWRYDGMFSEKDIPSDFVTFYGYENYALFASPVTATMTSSEDTYTSSDGKIWIYNYEYTPKSIGVVSLITFVQASKNATHKPLFVRVWYSLPGGFQKTAPEVTTGKKEAASIVDTFVF